MSPGKGIRGPGLTWTNEALNSREGFKWSTFGVFIFGVIQGRCCRGGS